MEIVDFLGYDISGNPGKCIFRKTKNDFHIYVTDPEDDNRFYIHAIFSEPSNPIFQRSQKIIYGNNVGKSLEEYYENNFSRASITFRNDVYSGTKNLISENNEMKLIKLYITHSYYFSNKKTWEFFITTPIRSDLGLNQLLGQITKYSFVTNSNYAERTMYLQLAAPWCEAEAKFVEYNKPVLQLLYQDYQEHENFPYIYGTNTRFKYGDTAYVCNFNGVQQLLTLNSIYVNCNNPNFLSVLRKVQFPRNECLDLFDQAADNNVPLNLYYDELPIDAITLNIIPDQSEAFMVNNIKSSVYKYDSINQWIQIHCRDPQTNLHITSITQVKINLRAQKKVSKKGSRRIKKDYTAKRSRMDSITKSLSKMNLY